MNAIPAQEIKRRGIAAVDDLIDEGDLHIISQPRIWKPISCGSYVLPVSLCGHGNNT
jgi:hypothetical protein